MKNLRNFCGKNDRIIAFCGYILCVIVYNLMQNIQNRLFYKHYALYSFIILGNYVDKILNIFVWFVGLGCGIVVKLWKKC